MNGPESLPLDPIVVKTEAAWQHFNPCGDRLSKQIPVAGICAVARREGDDIRPAQAGNQDTSCIRKERRQFLQVFLAAFRDGVWEERNLALTPGGVFHFNVDGALIVGAVVWGKQ